MLVGYETTLSNVSKFQNFGPNPKGIEVWAANGHFSLMHMRPDLPKIASNSPQTPTPEEAKAIVGGLFASFGTHTIDETNKTFIIQPEGGMFAKGVGTDTNVTIVSLTAAELKWSLEAGGQNVATLRRAK